MPLDHAPPQDQQQVKLSEQIEFLFEIMEETQVKILTRLEELQKQHHCNGKKWEQRLQKMAIAAGAAFPGLPDL